MTRRKQITLGKKTKKKELPPIQCRGCQTWFIPKDERQKFHLESCRVAYQQRTYWPKNETTKQCIRCKAWFKTTKGKLQVYCSEDCRVAAAKDRYEERMVAYKKYKGGVMDVGSDGTV